MSSRGKPKPKLRDLSRAIPTDQDKDTWISSIYKQHPMVCAIWGTSMVEHELEDLIRHRLRRNDDKIWAKLTDRNAALSSLSSKIDVAYAMGIYDESMQLNLHIIREIRNVFAHAKRVVTFDDPLILAELRKLHVPAQPGFKRNIRFIKQITNGGGYAFAALCLIVNAQFLRIRTRSLKAKTVRMKVKANKRRGWGLWADLMKPIPPSPLPVSSLQLSQLGQTEHPNPPTPRGLLDGLSGLFGLGEEYQRRTDNKK
jgi:DNA-binding MltR family transcriptional regulator